MSKKSWHILFSKLLYKLGPYFLDIQYEQFALLYCRIKFLITPFLCICLSLLPKSIQYLKLQTASIIQSLPNDTFWFDLRVCLPIHGFYYMSRKLWPISYSNLLNKWVTTFWTYSMYIVTRILSLFVLDLKSNQNLRLIVKIL